jgi:hypothetical protein
MSRRLDNPFYTSRIVQFIKFFVNECQSSRRYGAEGPGQLLVGVGDLGCNRGRDGCAPAPRRGRATGTAPFMGPAVSALAL